ncbi:uncharacterized protein BJ212DRAFT_1371461 [Suillus subaureus]|uniref:Uncharacterized protein n=1 Tax=Suillus subaureus TaxID=48587 RepID=A0A9P7E631_9AGAM|nr:uncharacterized protein BJ212DRAFT_1371461 [Suillus subaureus]KAG1812112.1 hypothetical protein BJ212DRAFT_1371461 [Suillus subaureus]
MNVLRHAVLLCSISCFFPHRVTCYFAVLYVHQLVLGKLSKFYRTSTEPAPRLSDRMSSLAIAAQPTREVHRKDSLSTLSTLEASDKNGSVVFGLFLAFTKSMTCGEQKTCNNITMQ